MEDPAATPHPPCAFTFRAAATPADLQAFARLALEYSAFLGIDLAFQAFEQELASLPGCYAPPGGFILLACCADTGEPVGCVAVRPLSANASAAATLQQHEQQAACQPGLQPLQLEAACEMKRLWVCRHCTGSGLGRALAAAAVDRARAAGYKSMVLDTIESLGAANRLYARLGFVRRLVPYCHNPLDGAVFWQLDFLAAEPAEGG